MRQLKTFMRNRKKEMIWCEPCECRTLQCRRYANENCGCGGATVNPKATWDSDYDWLTMIVWYMWQLWFTVTPEDFNFIVNLSNNNFEVLNIADDWAHHTVSLQAIRFVEGDNSTVITIEDWNGNVLASANIYTAQPIDTVSAPSEDSVTIPQGGVSGEITFTYTPTDANIWFNSEMSDYSIAQMYTFAMTHWTGILTFNWLNVGTTTFTYWGADSSNRHSIDITVDPVP